ncbi:MAG: hypothetical protein HY289_14710 [Planctomycetes bacterium]|nr:hypothetical protein [Planctomycetota bacterium]
MKRQESAQRRYLDAIKEHAKVRKLLPGAAKAAKPKLIDPLTDLRFPAVAANSKDETLVAAFTGPARGNSMADPLMAAKPGQPEPNSFTLDFPRISAEHEADALVNGVGVMN